MQVPDWLHPPERWYRDVWLFIITGLVAVALLSYQNALDEIQQSRLEVCQQQNERHDATIRTLDARIAELPTGPEKERAARNRNATVSLIAALAPRRNCRALIATK